MKKILVIVMIICLMTSALCVFTILNESTPESQPHTNIEPVEDSFDENENVHLGTWITLDGDRGEAGYYSASLFGEGSLAMIVAFLALIVSVISICLTVSYNKKKTSPSAANNAENSEDNE